jgi:hypothetical protein
LLALDFLRRQKAVSSPPVSSAARERSSVDREIARSMHGVHTFWTAAAIAVLSIAKWEAFRSVADLQILRAGSGEV